MSSPARNSDLRPSGHNTAKIAAIVINARMNQSAMAMGLHHGCVLQNRRRTRAHFGPEEGIPEEPMIVTIVTFKLAKPMTVAEATKTFESTAPKYKGLA